MNRNITLWDNLELKVPLIQGGMGIGISLSSLAGAVAGEGGIGIISAAQIGFREKDFDQNSLKANLRAMKSELEKARSICRKGIIGFNIMKAMRHYEEYVKNAVRIGADIIVSGAGLPMDLPEIVMNTLREQGEKIKKRPLLAPIISTDKAANVILKYWGRKYQIMPDLLVIEGPKAGGHLGFSTDQLETFQEKEYEEEVRRIMDTVHGYEKKYSCRIPTAIGGGIDTKEAADRAFDLGADLIQVASRFVTTRECDADIRYKEAYLKAEKEDIVIVKSPVGMPGRAIKNKFMERVMSGEQIPHSRCHGCLHKCSPAEIPYCITDALIHAAKGEVDDALLFCGACAYQSKKIETVKDVIDSLVR